jgi:hypothetical protein
MRLPADCLRCQVAHVLDLTSAASPTAGTEPRG